MSECKDCRYFDSFWNECTVDYKSFNKDATCDIFKQRKKCEHRYENCDGNGCSIICHRCPSERGCRFYYQCKLDDYLCDENCDIHKDRHEYKELNEEKSKLYDTKYTIEKTIKRYDKMIKEIEERLKISN